jgi:hypothetical protein
MLVSSGEACAHGFAVVVWFVVSVDVAGDVSKKLVICQPPTAEKSKLRSVAALTSWLMTKLPLSTDEINQTAVDALALRAVSVIREDADTVGNVTAVEEAPGVSVTWPTLFDRPSTSSFVVETMA